MKKSIGKLVGMLVMFSMIFFLGVPVVQAQAKNAEDYTLTVTTNRTEGNCEYQLQGVDPTETSSVEVKAQYVKTSGATEVCYDQVIDLTSENCVDGVFRGSFSMDDMTNFSYQRYTVSCTVGDVEVTGADTCDFSLHTGDYQIITSGEKTDSIRKTQLSLSESATDVIAPGSDNKVALYVWKKGNDERKAIKVGDSKLLSTKNVSWSFYAESISDGTGTYYAKLFLEHNGKSYSMGSSSFSVGMSSSSFTTSKSKTLEKKAAFAVTLKGLKSPMAVKKVAFYVYNSAGKKVYGKTATDKNGDGSVYYAEIKLKSLNYKLGKYTIKAYITDKNGDTSVLSKKTSVSEQASAKSLQVTKKTTTRSSYFTLKKAYIPGGIKEVRFFVYYKSGSTYKLQSKVKSTYKAKGDAYKASVKNKKAGSYKVRAYGYTNWGSKVLLKQTAYKVKKSEAQKNGWLYEKYNGKTYKFYYKNGVKQKDLTKILGLKFSSSSNVNKFYIEVNRAACCVTVYAYDSVKKKYIIPVKTFTVSVGRDLSTTAGAGALNTNTSFTPIGTYSICTNGVSPKYSMKQMYEPDGSICYARWASHVVGNVYFHCVAVGSDSHYALSPATFNRLGSAASAGCIRMMVADAKWLYDYASVGSTVKIVVGSTSHPGPLGKAKTIKIASSIHYDPTDPGVPDSRKKADYKAGRITGYMTNSGKKVGY